MEIKQSVIEAMIEVSAERVALLGEGVPGPASPRALVLAQRALAGFEAGGLLTVL